MNSLIFLLMGLQLARQDIGRIWLTALIGIGVVLLGRAAAVYGCSALFARSSQRVEFRHQHLLFWGGLRGALALALTLGLPPDLPFRQAMVTLSFAVVAFSVIVQGITMIPLLRRLGITDPA
jgi:CPA1 family monovalent cation:H+ antiporter